MENNIFALKGNIIYAKDSKELCINEQSYLVCENGNIIGNSYYIIVWRKTVPVRKWKINTIDQGNYYDCRPD